jgi:hypothetical protein
MRSRVPACSWNTSRLFRNNLIASFPCIALPVQTVNLSIKPYTLISDCQQISQKSATYSAFEYTSAPKSSSDNLRHMTWSDPTSDLKYNLQVSKPVYQFKVRACCVQRLNFTI